jgi:CDP-4-dehydro-6-deoxyglucose reductase
MRVAFEGCSFELLPEETLLEGIERCAGGVPYFCRRGVCQACLVKATAGEIPALAQKGLREVAKRQSLLLSCVCRPTGDLTIERYGGGSPLESRVEQVEALPGNVLRVLVSAPPSFVYEAGQYVQLVRPSDGLMRPYSIASLPGDARMELHVACLPGGAMSGWLGSAVGERVGLRGPFGECVYFPDEPDRPLCLVGTGTGLAPLLGVVRAALAAGHRGRIRLFHGSLRPAGLYLWAELRALLATAPQLSLVGSVLEDDEPGPTGRDPDERCSIRVASLEAALAAEGQSWTDHRVYLCGNDELVRKLQRKLYLTGVPLARIHADPFVAPGVRA